MHQGNKIFSYANLPIASRKRLYASQSSLFDITVEVPSARNLLAGVLSRHHGAWYTAPVLTVGRHVDAQRHVIDEEHRMELIPVFA